MPREASSTQVADAVICIWGEVDQALSPIVGQRGVAALYSRSLKLSTAAHPWLAPGYQSALSAVDTSTLRTALAQQTPEEAAAGGSALFKTFHELLASLVGPALTEQLLISVWAESMDWPPEQETPS